MKRLIIIAICLVSLNLSDQGNLQFNQVINQVFNGTYNTYFEAGTITVPAGKVWKIEAASLTRTDSSPVSGVINAGSFHSLTIAGHVAYYSSAPESSNFPIWLSEGTYPVGGYVSSSIPSRVSISAIEFNVVP